MSNPQFYAPVITWIHLRYSEIFTYSPGWLLGVQNSTLLNIPTNILLPLFIETKGVPSSPRQVLPPWTRSAAQNDSDGLANG